MAKDVDILTAHGAVILLLESNGRLSAAELATGCGLTERHIARVLRDLRQAGYVHRIGNGGGSRWIVNGECGLTRPAFVGVRLREILPAARSIRLPEP